MPVAERDYMRREQPRARRRGFFGRLFVRLLKIVGGIVVVLVALTILLVVFVEPDEEPMPGSSANRASAKVHDLSYHVVSVRNARSVPGVLEPRRAKGVFVIVRLRVENVGTEPFEVITEPHLIGGNGKAYSAFDVKADNAQQFLAGGGAWLIELQPEFSDVATLIFDVAPSAARRPRRLRLETCDYKLVSEELVSREQCEQTELPLKRFLPP